MFLLDLLKPKEDKLEVIDFNKVFKNKTLMSKLRKLTICTYSGMNYELDVLSKVATTRHVNAKVITLSRNKKIVGWALLSKEASDFSFAGGKFNPKTHGALFEVFVDPKFRRTGIGSALLKRARKHAGSAKLCVAPHDKVGFLFYNKNRKYKQKRI